MINPWFIVGVVGIAGAAFWFGDRNGHARCTAQHQAETLERIKVGQKLEAARIQVARERDVLARQLEEQANEDPVIVSQCLSPSRVRRLNGLNK